MRQLGPSSRLLGQGPARLIADRVWQAAELLQLRDTIAQRLAGHVPAAAAVAIVGTNSGEGVALLGAALDLEHPILLLPASLRPDEAAGALISAAIGFVVAPAAALSRLSLAGWRAVWEERDIRLLARAGLETDSPIDGLPVLCQLTSGSTGPSRFAVRSLDGVAREADVVAETLHLELADRVLCASSIAHSYALVGGLIAASRRGAEVILAPAPGEAAARAAAVNPSVFFGLPGSYRVLLNQPGAFRPRLALSAGAPLPDGLYDAFLRATGIPIRQDYGTTETGTIALDAGPEPSPHTVGHTLPHLEVDLSPVGEVLVRSQSVAAVYIENGQLVPALGPGGWYHTGDLGSRDAPGRLRLSGRVRPPLEVDGEVVPPERVEEMIAAHQAVREVVVLPMRAADGRPALRAVVVAPGLTAPELRDWCVDRLPSAFVPAELELRDSLPYSPAGKLLRKYL
ncbi:MAG TPA: class I adenylate-forming enzyme family protein [Chloroflexota bacterium]|nr:class I adenylate-forming enzyme family protein [Chloroflexota bacterium]